MSRPSIRLLVSLAVLTGVPWPGGRATIPQVPAKLWQSRPVALVLADEGRWLFVANQRRGTISTVDTGNARVTEVTHAGRKLADLAVTPDGRQLLAVDEEKNELIVLERRGPRVEVRERLPVSPAPVSVGVAKDGARCWVASLWSRRLTVVDLRNRRVVQSIGLEFAPRHQLAVRNDTKLIVADAFGGRLAVVDLVRGAVESVRTLPAHNIGGLAVSRDGKDLLISHQILNRLAETTRTDIHWGNLITNNLRVLPLADVLAPKADLVRGSRLHSLGDVGRGAGDPAGIAVGSDGKVVVALAGVNEIAVQPAGPGAWHRLPVGHRPTAVVASPDKWRAYVANTLGDSISVVDLNGEKVAAEISLGSPPVSAPADKGEALFYDARLSLEGWFSCHSCHTDGHTNGLLADTLGDDSFGTPKRVLTLRGVHDTGPWAWNGSMPDLESQIEKSLRTTMRSDKPTNAQVKALAAFLRTLPPPPSAEQAGEQLDRVTVRRGRELFEEQGCAGCHAPPTYTSRKTYDVGLEDEAGHRHFNPPSLRGVAQGGPFFHDNRAATLEDVLGRFRHQLKSDLTEEEVRDLVTFLRSI